MKNDLAKTVALLRKSYSGELTVQEQAEVKQLLADEGLQKLYTEIKDDEYLIREFQRYTSWQPFRGYQKFQIKRQKARIRKIAVNSSIAAGFLIAFGSIWWTTDHGEPKESLPVAVATIEPGNSRALLSLSNGKQVALSADNQLNIQDLNENIRVDSGKVIYSASWSGDNKAREAYHILSVPRGGEYRLTLSDGTTVHLNADSELKYPVAFSRTERKVFLKGEGWFEVAKETVRPFYVETDDVRLRVYGTIFNINTHGIHKTRAVLVDGKVGIGKKDGPEEYPMHPGQLASYDRHSGEITLKEVDVYKYTAWKEGEFCFNGDTLEEILEELGRWYNVNIFFNSPGKKEVRFSGYLKRYADIHKILNTITESTGIAFEINAHSIIVK